MDPVSRLEERDRVKWTERKGKKRETSIKAGRMLGPGQWRRGRATCGTLWKGSWKSQVQSCGDLFTKNICSCTDTLCKGGWGQGLETREVGEGPQTLLSEKHSLGGLTHLCLAAFSLAP